MVSGETREVSRCEGCDDAMDGLGVSTIEAFETTGKFLCDDCAEDAFEGGNDGE